MRHVLRLCVAAAALLVSAQAHAQTDESGQTWLAVTAVKPLSDKVDATPRKRP